MKMMDGKLSAVAVLSFLAACILMETTGADNLTPIQEVQLGDMAVLNCTSNDDDHRFQFWLINTKEVVGPGNVIDRLKYKYEVLTGQLFIKNVTPKEHGLYTCFCRHLSETTYNVKSIELVVKRDWEDVYENDYTTNVFRILLLVGTVLLLAILLFLVFTLRENRSSFLKDLSDEESPDEGSHNKPGSSTYSRIVSPPDDVVTPRRGVDNRNFDNVSLDTEFPNEFQTSALLANTSRI